MMRRSMPTEAFSRRQGREWDSSSARQGSALCLPEATACDWVAQCSIVFVIAAISRPRALKKWRSSAWKLTAFQHPRLQLRDELTGLLDEASDLVLDTIEDHIGWPV
ncbi:hypothetical protein NL676_022732 [Syzygium grande]|nr:hypothetical protein NL676_022732 [Syzygium grande]